MPIHTPPYYRYALYEDWDRDVYDYLKQLRGHIPEITIIGSQTDRDQLLTTLIRAQKALNDWRDMLKDVVRNIQEEVRLDCPAQNAKFPPESISKETPAWVTYREDQTVNEFIDQLGARTVTFTGNDKEMTEFILRFTLGQIGHDWEQTILMIWEILGEQQSIALDELNAELKNFDYPHAFDPVR